MNIKNDISWLTTQIENIPENSLLVLGKDGGYQGWIELTQEEKDFCINYWKDRNCVLNPINPYLIEAINKN